MNDKELGELLKKLYQKELIECCTDPNRPSKTFDWVRVAKKLIDSTGRV